MFLKEKSSTLKNDRNNVDHYQRRAGKRSFVFLALIRMILIYTPANVCFPLGKGRGAHYWCTERVGGAL